VNDCVESASSRDSDPDSLYGRRDLTGNRHIQNDRLDGSLNPARSRLGQERIDIFLLSHPGQHAVTVFCQGKGGLATDSSRCAGDLGWDHVKAFCETLTEAEEALAVEMVSRITDKWSLWTMSVIAELGQPMRFSRIMDGVEGISQKSLTKTLRGLERDGLITRQVFAEVPPRVEYTITALDSEMLDNVAPLWLWAGKTVQRFQDRRAAFDRREILRGKK
jgi:DNA-binding HxlR family transcriptional regulator